MWGWKQCVSKKVRLGVQWTHSRAGRKWDTRLFIWAPSRSKSPRFPAIPGPPLSICSSF